MNKTQTETAKIITDIVESSSQTQKQRILSPICLKQIIKTCEFPYEFANENKIWYSNMNIQSSEDSVIWLEKAISRRVHSKNWKNIETLKLSNAKNESQYSYMPEVTRQDFEKLISSITECSSQLKNLELEFQYWYDMDDNMLQVFAVQIGRKLRNLRQLRLGFKQWIKVTDHGMEKFAREICRNLIYLNRLSLDFSIADDTDVNGCIDHGLEALSNEIARYLNNLEHLNLDFLNQVNISVECVEKCINKISSRLDKLQTLSFSFGKQTISEQCHKTLLQTVCTNLKGLKHLQFYLSYIYEIPTKMLWFTISEVSQHLVNLESLSVFFLSDYDTTLNQYYEYTYHTLTSLKALELTLLGSIASEICIIRLNPMITKHFPNLEQLTMRFGCPSEWLNQKSLQVLIFDTPYSLLNLKTFCVDASSCGLEKNQNWKEWLVIEAEKPVLSLRSLDLIFMHWSQVTEDFLEALGKKISYYFSELTSLTIDFSWCKTPIEGLEMFEKRINESLIHLKTFNLITTQWIY